MPKILENELKSSIKLGNFSNLYFLFGEEKYLTEHYTNLLVSKITGNDSSDFNFQKFKFNHFNINALNDAVEALPFMAEKKCVLVSSLDIEAMEQSEVEKLKEIISDIPESTVFIFSQVSVEINLKKSSKWASFIKFIEEHGASIEFKKLSKTELSKQIISWCKKLSVVLSLKNAEKIIDICGNDLTEIKNQVEKLCAFSKGREILEEDIDIVVDKKLEANVFDLVKLVVSGKCTEAYKKLDILISKKEEPVAILAVISSMYIDMYRVKVAMQSEYSASSLKDFFDYKRKEFKIDIAKKECSNFSISKLRECINLLTETDFKLKSCRIDSKILLEELITKLTLIMKK